MAAKKAVAKKAAVKKPAKKAASKKAAVKPAASKKALKKTENKTKPTKADVSAFIDKVENETRRKDAKALLAMMKKITGETPKMWAPSIVGFGSDRYKYESGREGDMIMTGFSPRSSASVVYVMGGVPDTDDLYKRLGKHSLGKSCLYIKRLEDVDMKTLEKIVSKSVAHMRKKTGAA